MHKVDTKGRVSIPASFRRVLEASDPEWKKGRQPRVYVNNADTRHPWLVAYCVQAMEEIYTLIQRMQRGSVNRNCLEQFYYANSQLLQIDDSGRLILSKELRTQARIETEAVFKSEGDSFRIMAPEADTTDREKLHQWLENQGQSFDPASLLPSVSSVSTTVPGGTADPPR